VCIFFLVALIIWVGEVAGERPESSRQQAVQTQLKGLAEFLAVFKEDYCRYPTTDEGFGALLHPERLADEKCRAEPRYYLDKMPVDAWGNEFEYLSPGVHNPQSYDLWSLGADGLPGGEGLSTDCGNWAKEDCDLYQAYLLERGPNKLVYLILLVPGFIIGLPWYIYYSIARYRKGTDIRTFLSGDHLRVFLYILLWTTGLIVVAVTIPRI